jgi:hypothetical protein
MTIVDTLNDRESQYGDFGELARAIQAFKSVARASPSWPRMTSTQREASEMILMKMCRLLYGNPMHFDTWHDVAGYAALAVEEFHPNERGTRANGEPMKAAANPQTPLELEKAVTEDRP